MSSKHILFGDAKASAREGDRGRFFQVPEASAKSGPLETCEAGSCPRKTKSFLHFDPPGCAWASVWEQCRPVKVNN
jgi:hypothetical protein